MPDKLPPEQVALYRHLADNGCVPFPAGPLVPREHTLGTPPAWRATGAAADLACEILAQDLADTLMKDNAKSSLSRLLSHPAVGWASHHPALVAGLEEHPATAVMRAIYDLRQTAAARHGREVVLSRWRQNFVTSSRKDRLDHDGLHAVAYAAPAYRCSCEATHTEPVPLAIDASRDPDPALVHLLEHPGSEWWLMGRLFLKLLHGHLAWVPATKVGQGEAAALRDRMHQCLLARARAPGGSAQELADGQAAPGLSAGLDWSLPRKLKVSSLPSALVDCVPHYEAEVLASAVDALAGGEVRRARFFEVAIAAVARLARDVAADLTAPQQMLRSGLSGTHYAYLAYAYESRHKGMRRLAAALAGRGADQASRKTAVDVRLDPHFVSQALQPRMALLKAYTTWMSVRGHDVVKHALTKPSSAGTAAEARL
jgi:hypothetical protein